MVEAAVVDTCMHGRSEIEKWTQSMKNVGYTRMQLQGAWRDVRGSRCDTPQAPKVPFYVSGHGFGKLAEPRRCPQ